MKEQKQKLKGIMTTWHTPHQYDLASALKDYVDFDVIINSNKDWKGRPLPDNAKLVPFYDKKVKYDFAVLNLDQQCLHNELGKSEVQRDLRSVIDDIPVIIIQHGTPVWPERLQTNDMTARDAQDLCIKLTKEMIGDRTMVVNSYTAATDAEWGFGYPIVHGMNPDLWKPAEQKEPYIISGLSPRGFDSYYNRAFLEEFDTILKRKYGYKLQWARRNVDYMDQEQYAEWMGKSLIYIDPSFRTPMNRSRTEAMLSGCAVVQVEGAHDLDRFFHPGEDIYIVPKDSPEYMADFVYDLIENKFEEAVQVGKNARENAIKQFSYERYRNDWLTLLKKLEILK